MNEIAIVFLFLLLIFSCSLSNDKGDTGVDTSVHRLEIVFPSTSASYSEDQTVDLVASGNSSICRWNSLIHGELGEGYKIAVKLLPGNHIITAKGDDGAISVPIEISVNEIKFLQGQSVETFIYGSKNILLDKGTYSPLFVAFNSEKSARLSVEYRSVAARCAISENQKFNKIAINTNLYKIRNIDAVHANARSGNEELNKYTTGDRKAFNMVNISSGNAMKGYQVNAELKYIRDQVLFWYDMSSDYTDLVEIVNDCEQIVGQTTKLFGDWKDVDNDGYISILLSDKINKSDLAIGFFNPSDFFPCNEDSDSEEYNPNSNYMDIMYVGTPDSTFAFSEKSLSATIAHELQHLIHYSLKTYSQYELGNTEPPEEELFLDEGLAHLSESLNGYGISGGNILFIEKYLAHTNNFSLVYNDVNGNNDSAGKRGGNCLFFSYLFWKSGGVNFEGKTIVDTGGIEFLQKLLKSNYTGIRNIENATGEKFDTLFKEWCLYVASVCRGVLADFAPQLHPVTGEPINIPIIANDLKVTDDNILKLNGIMDVTSMENVLLLPYSFVKLSNFCIENKQYISMENSISDSSYVNLYMSY